MARAVTDLEGYNVKELRELKERVDAVIVEKQKLERIELKSKFAELAEAAGLSLDDVLGMKRRGGGKGSVAAKYRNPENPEETWTGRGRMPNWLGEKMKKRGVSKEDFAI
ncbi:MAG: H-NS histone family protein [Hyphomicrobium sp.]